jgi:dTDP-4-amino-4,6-dideoxygalactose transaminase
MAVAQVGATPVGVDITLSTGGMDPVAAEAAVGSRTRALVAVHLFGLPADVAALQAIASAASIPLVEDAAQAHGALIGGRPVGSLGAIGAFSFYPTKNLAAMGDAGAVTTGDSGLADRVRLLREYGWRTRADSEMKGVNARLDELQAALLRVMLHRLTAATERRRAIAATYLAELSEAFAIELPVPLAGTEPAWHLFVVRHPRRDALAGALAAAGIETAIHYPRPPHLTSAFREDGWREGNFPAAESHAATALSLPMHPALQRRDVNHVIEAVLDACGDV